MRVTVLRDDVLLMTVRLFKAEPFVFSLNDVLESQSGSRVRGNGSD